MWPVRPPLSLLTCIAAAGCSLAFAATASADYVVDDLDDPFVGGANGICDAQGGDTCTLREALVEANNTVGLDTITFSVSGPIELFGQLTTSQPTVIDGNGPANTIVDGNDAVRLFAVSNAATTFKDMRLQDGSVVNDPFQGGAAIQAIGSSANVTLDNAVVTSNQVTGTGSGNGAILGADDVTTLSVTESTISNNTVSTTVTNAGAGISWRGPVDISGSVIRGNMITAGTGQLGGGLAALAAVNITSTEISGNSVANGRGGGAWLSSGAGAREITNSTISGNSSGTVGGGGLHFNGSSQSLTLVNDTFANNSGGSGSMGEGDDLEIQSGLVTVGYSIFASAEPCLNPVAPTTLYGNIDEGETCNFGTNFGNLQNTSAMLQPLALNPPGQTMTHALSFGSVAIDYADAGCGGGLAADQRGILRPQGPACDVGAYEREYRLLTVSVAGSGTVNGPGISCGIDCTESKLDGSPPITVTATPAAGLQLSSFSGCDSVSGNQCTVNFNADKTVTANFAPPPSGGGSSGGGGSTTPAPPKCKKRQKLKNGKCVKKKRKKRK